MSDNRKKSKRRRSTDEIPELSPLDKTIAKYLRFQCPTKKGVLMGMQVVYFNGSKAVECLTESKWSSMSSKASSTESKHPVCLRTKHDVIQMLRKFLENEMFRRVVKVYKEEKPVKDKNVPLSSTESTNAAGDTSQSNTPRSVRQRKTKSAAVTNVSGPVTSAEITSKDDESKDKEQSKKTTNTKKKFKFEFHDDQQLIDSPNDFYVWIYSPTTIKQYIMGALLVIGCIGVCLFPLWPAEVRTGVYYLSLVLASLLGLLLSLAVIKYIIFAGIWLLTMGKIKFWLLPNLTEDVGFVESFIPLYVLDIASKKKKETKKDGEVEASNKEDISEEKKKPSPAATTTAEPVITSEKTANKEDHGEEDDDEEDENDDDDKEGSTSRSSSVGEMDDGSKPHKSSDEDFEVLSKDELETK